MFRLLQPRLLSSKLLDAMLVAAYECRLTPANITSRIFAAVRTEPAGYSVDVDPVADENALLAHNGEMSSAIYKV